MAQYGAAASTAAAPQQQQQHQGQDAHGVQHKRVYQACIPCRRRKVRCDLGSVDNPNDPPCVRCRRESKECFFSATRRKRKHEDGEGSDVDDYTVRNGRKRVNASEETPPQQIDRRLFTEQPLTPGGSQGRSQPLRRPGTGVDEDISAASESLGRLDHRDTDFGADGDDNQQIENPDAQTVMRRGVYGPHDALDLLYKAATDTDRFVQAANAPSTRQQPADSSNSPMNAHHTRQQSRASGISLPRQTSFEENTDRRRSRPNAAAGPAKSEQPVDPELGSADLSAQPGYAEAIRAWTRFRFVRAGWFTPHEAIEYID